MKKVILLFTISLTILMAEMTLKGGQLTNEPVTTTEPTPESGTITLPDGSRLIPNTVDKMIEDMYGENTGWVSHMPSGYGQFKGPILTFNWRGHKFDKMLIWLEIEAGGDGSSCSPDTNTAVNTAVEVGYIRSYTKRNNKWELSLETKNMHDQQTGNQYQAPTRWDLRKCFPVGGMVPGRNGKLVQDDLYDNPDRRATNYPWLPSIINENTANGYLSVSPARLHRFHGWTKSKYIKQEGLQGYYGVAYVRLVLKDPNGKDDRYMANYVVHMASDIRKDPNNTYVDDIGMSRYKKITNDWVAINFFSNLTEQQIRDNPPPIITTP